MSFISKWIRIESFGVADQIMGQGYIPYYPFGGRHIMDDFGNLIQSLPQHQYDYEPKGIDWRLMWGYDIQYMYH